VPPAPIHRTVASWAGLPIGNTDPKEFPSQVGGNAYFDFVVEDMLVVYGNFDIILKRLCAVNEL